MAFADLVGLFVKKVVPRISDALMNFGNFLLLFLPVGRQFLLIRQLALFKG